MWNLKKQKHEYWAYLSDVFTEDDCNTIITWAKLHEEDGLVQGNRKEEKIRKNKVSWILPSHEEMNWVYKKITDAVCYINDEVFNYDLTYLEEMHVARYSNIGDHYVAHLDLGVDNSHYRKLSFSVQLSDENDYEGCDLLIADLKKPLPRQKGIVNFFPSYMIHEVTPLLSGERIALIGWVCGPRFK